MTLENIRQKFADGTVTPVDIEKLCHARQREAAYIAYLNSASSVSGLDGDNDVPAIQAFQAQSALSQAAIEQAIINASTQNNTDLVNLLTEALAHTILLGSIDSNTFNTTQAVNASNIQLGIANTTLTSIDNNVAANLAAVGLVEDAINNFATQNNLDLGDIETILASVDGRVLTSNTLLTQLSNDIQTFATQNSLDLGTVVTAVNAVTSTLQPILASIDTNLAAVLLELQTQLPDIINELQGLDSNDDLAELLTIITELNSVNTNLLNGNTTLANFFAAFQAYQTAFANHATVLVNFAAANSTSLGAINTLLTTANGIQNAILVELTAVGVDVENILLTLQSDLPDIIQELQDNGSQNALDLAAILTELQGQSVTQGTISSTLTSIFATLLNLENLVTNIDNSIDNVEALLGITNGNLANLITTAGNIETEIINGFAQNDLDNAQIIAELQSLNTANGTIITTLTNILNDTANLDANTITMLNELIDQGTTLDDLLTEFTNNTVANQNNEATNLASLGELQTIVTALNTLIANNTSDNAAILLALGAIESDVVAGAASVVAAVQAQFDYETQWGISNTDPARLIIRSTWINKTTGVKTVQYYEQDGVTTTTDVFADVQDVEYVTDITRWRTASGGDTTDYYLHTTYAVENGISTVVNQVYRDELGVIPLVTPLGLVPYDESDSARQRHRFFEFSSNTASDLVTLIGGLASNIVSATFTVVKWDEPDEGIFISDGAGGTFNFAELYESKPFDTVASLQGLIFDGSLTVESTTANDANVVRATIQYKD